MLRTLGRIARDATVFVGLMAATFVAVFAMGVFQSPGNQAPPMQRVKLLPEVASELLSDRGIENWVPEPFRLAMFGEPLASPAPLYYAVEAGDTLAGIASLHETSVGELVSHNSLLDPNVLEIGQRIELPADGRDIAEAAADGDAPEAAGVVPKSGWLGSIEGIFNQARGVPDPGPTKPAEEHVALEELLAMAEEELRAANFADAEHSAKAAERLLRVQPDGAELAPQRARLEVVRATIHSAFGNGDEVQRSLERALDADPDLVLDPISAPRKLQRALDAIRETAHVSAQPPGST